MPSTASPRLRIELQATGENVNTWGERLDDAIERLEESIAGLVSINLTGNYTLVSSNFVEDEARQSTLKVSSTGAYAITVPGVEKVYDVWNTSAYTVQIKTSGGTAADISAGSAMRVICDGVDCKAQASGSLGSWADGSAGTPGIGFANDVDTGVRRSATNAWILMAGGTDVATITTTAFDVLSLKIAGNTTGPAADTDLWTGTNAYKWLTPDSVYDANVPITLTDGGTITPDYSTGLNFDVTLGGNRTLANPTNMKVGQSGKIRVRQDATGSRTLSFGAYYKFNGGAPTLTTTANAYDTIWYFVDSSTFITCLLSKAHA